MKLGTLSVVILTYNEESNLPACLESLQGLHCDIFVVDSGSTDLTVQIAEAAGVSILRHNFESHAKQWHWALGQLPAQYEWVLGLDADQRLSDRLRQELNGLFGVGKAPPTGIDGFYVNRKQVFRDRWIRHGGYYPKYLLKLFRRANVWTDPADLVDHHFYVRGNVQKLEHDLIEDNHKENDISFWIAKHNGYAKLLAAEELARRKQARAIPLKHAWSGMPDQRTLALKRIWFRLPLYLRPVLYFFYRFVLRLGFLDGKQGMIFHFLQGFWFRLLVDINLDEMISADRSLRYQSERVAS